MINRDSLSGRIDLRWRKFLKWWALPAAVLRLCRASLAVTAAGFALVLILQQGREAVYASENPFRYFILSLLLAVTTWFWARLTLDIRFPRQYAPPGLPNGQPTQFEKRQRRWVDWTPRIIGALPLAGSALAMLFMARDFNFTKSSLLRLALSVVCLAAFFAAVTWRTALSKKLFLPGNKINTDGFWYVAVSAFALSFIFTGLNLWFPSYLGTLFSAAGIVFWAGIAAASILGSFTYVLARANGGRGKPFPLLTLIGVATLAISFVCCDPYAVRSVARETPRVVRPSLEAAARSWVNEPNVKTFCRGSDGHLRMVLVATAGGASRAAYWTGAVLGEAAARPGIARRLEHCLFAVSSVSGGSLGAAAFVSMLRGRDAESGRQRMRSMLETDFLGPVLGALAINDGILAPSRLLRLFGAKTRAEALETAWETASADLKGLPFDRPFLDLWPGMNGTGESAWPILLLNGTEVESGRRIITSNIVVGDQFVNADDFEEVNSLPVAVSTAVHNSARFSYISPSGTLANGRHIIDGGYFENYGATTLVELIQALRGIDEYGDRVKFVVLQIASDPDLPPGTITPVGTAKSSRHQTKSGPVRSGSFASNQLLHPVDGLLNARQARGVYAALQLAKISTCHFHFLNLEMPEGAPRPALSWLLPEETRKSIDDLLDTAGPTQQAFAKFLADVEGGTCSS